MHRNWQSEIKTSWLIDKRNEPEGWIRLISLASAILAACLWWIIPGITWQPLILVLAPPGVSLILGRSLLVKSKVDPFVAFFFATAFLGAWIAYDNQIAVSKFWILISAILIFYAVVMQNPLGIRTMLIFAGAGVVILVFYFAFSYDYKSSPTDIDILNQLGEAWMRLRTQTIGSPMVNDIAGGIIAFQLPLFLSQVAAYWKEQKKSLWVYFLIITFISAIGLIITGARSAWFSMAAAVFIAAVIYGWITIRPNLKVLRTVKIFVGVLLVILLIATAVWIWFHSVDELIANARELFLQLPGSGSSRVRLLGITDALYLASDYTYTGGGLNAYSGNYSRYIQFIPLHYYDYSHSLFIDIYFEQGIIGLVTFSTVYLFSFILLIRQIKAPQPANQFSKLFGWCLLFSFLIVFINGLIEDPLYGIQGSPYLFFLPGITIASLGIEKSQRGKHSNFWEKFRIPPPGYIMAAAFIVAAAAVVVIVRWNEGISRFYSNIGALNMARLELTGWPTSMPEEYQAIPELENARKYLVKALEIDPDNITAHQRLAIIAMREHNFRMAISHLEYAARLNPDHYGIRKMLGINYVWVGKIDRAYEILRWIKGADDEMMWMQYWWAQQGEVQLSELAGLMLKYLNEGEG